MYLAADYQSSDLIPIHLVPKADFDSWVAGLDTFEQSWLQAHKFIAKLGAHCVIPHALGGISRVVCVTDANTHTCWHHGALAQSLPANAYYFDTDLPDQLAFLSALAWGMANYTFTDFKKKPDAAAVLRLPNNVNADSLQHYLDAITHVRTLINLPANALGPDELAQHVVQVADMYGAVFKQTVGADLLSEGFPAIHTVGRASTRAPRLIECEWGVGNPFKLALIGKGVCFDSGGLDIKPSVGMRDMKKDMGGAAHALGLARLIMAHQLPIHLQLYIPAVDNVIAGNAYMPGDIIDTRAGLTVEVDNTDAEGRLILADAITLAASKLPDLMIDFATLTGAARVALGPDLPAMFANPHIPTDAILTVAEAVADPIWPMPLFEAYNAFIDSTLADVRSCGSGRYGGAITAALFLQKFVPADIPWMHFDIMAANTRNLPSKPEGGEAMAIRALFEYLQTAVAS